MMLTVLRQQNEKISNSFHFIWLKNKALPYFWALFQTSLDSTQNLINFESVSNNLSNKPDYNLHFPVYRIKKY